MTKYAMIWTTSRGYMPGTNAILNAMEYYKFPKEIDKYVMVFEDNNWSYKDPWWRKNWPDVKPLDMDGKFSPGRPAGWYLVFHDIYEGVKLLDEYDVVLFWGADVCVVNDFSEYFEVCHKLSRVILAHNEMGIQSYNGLSEKEPYRNTWDVPYADIPFFVPRSCKCILEDMLRFQTISGNTSDRMDGINYALRDRGLKPFVVPGVLWVLNCSQSATVLHDNNGALYINNQRMNSFHRKYWTIGLCKGYMSPTPGSVAAHNHLIFNRMWNFLNRQCRVKWEEGVEEWDGTL